MSAEHDTDPAAIDRADVNHETLLALAKKQRVSVTKLLAMSPDNDPFYVGRDSHHCQAKWFADVWGKFGFGPGTHLRRAHYRLISDRRPPTLPDGRAYANTASCWDY